MVASVRSTLLMLVGPLVVLLLWAHMVRPHWPGREWPAVLIAALVGLIGIATSTWRTNVKAVLAAAYVFLAMVGLPYLTLLAVCSTGDCLSVLESAFHPFLPLATLLRLVPGVPVTHPLRLIELVILLGGGGGRAPLAATGKDKR